MAWPSIGKWLSPIGSIIVTNVNGKSHINFASLRSPDSQTLLIQPGSWVNATGFSATLDFRQNYIIFASHFFEIAC